MKMRYAILDSDSGGTAYPPHGSSLRAHLLACASRTRRRACEWDDARHAYSLGRERLHAARLSRSGGGHTTAPISDRPRGAAEYPAYTVLCGGLYIVSDGFDDLYATDSEAEAEAIAHAITTHRARSWDTTQ